MDTGRWCEEMPRPIKRLPVDEIIEFVNNPPAKAQNLNVKGISQLESRKYNFESIAELFEFPDVDWEEPKENLTSGLVCETPLDPVPAETSPKIIGGKAVPIEHHPYIGKNMKR